MATRLSVGLLLLALTLPVSAAKEPAPPGSERVRVGLALIDVVVQDRSDQPVPGLTRADFEIRVDGRRVEPSEIERFEQICSAPEGTSPVSSASGPPALRHIVLYLDFSQMTLPGRQRVLQAAREHFAKGLDPSDRVMIVTHKNDLKVIQDFTADGSVLAARLDGLQDDASTLDTDVLEESQNIADVAKSSPDPRSLARKHAAKEANRAERSLRALEAFAASLSDLPGRKALVLATDVLRDEPGLQYLALAKTTPQAVGISIAEEIRQAIQEANAAGVSIYTVHAGGRPDDPHGVGLADKLQEMHSAIASGEASALTIERTLAKETGGRALLRNRDPAGVLALAQRDLSCYYLLGYRYRGRGDNKRHSLDVRLGPESRNRAGGSLTARHRPHFTDALVADRKRMMVHALVAPALYRALPVTGEAFALAPTKEGRRVLIRATVPIESLSMVPLDSSSVEGRTMVRGEVSQDGDAVFRFAQDVLQPRVPKSQKDARLVYQTGCILAPGNYTLTVAMMDRRTTAIGTRQVKITVPSADTRSDPYMSDVQIWARDPGALVVTVGTETIGVKESVGDVSFIPRAERRITRNQEAFFSFHLCPPTGSAATPEKPIQVRQTLKSEPGLVVPGFQFRDLSITKPLDGGTLCYELSSPLPAGRMASGIYSLTVEATGPVLGSPIMRRAALAVD